MSKTDKEILENYKARIKRQNKAIKEGYDKITAILPKGTVKRIKALGMSINKAVNDSLLSFLECMEEDQEEQQGEQICSVQSTETVQEELDVEETVSQEKPAIKETEKLSEKEEWMELQKQYEQRHEESKEWKRKQEERKDQAEKERQEEFKNLVNGVFEGMRAEKERMREEDRKKYKDISDSAISELLQDTEFSGWLESIGFENALDPLSDEIGINNAEKVINAAKERKRKETVEKCERSFWCC